MERLQSFIKYCENRGKNYLEEKRSFVGNPWFATFVPHPPSPVDKLLLKQDLFRNCSVFSTSNVPLNISYWLDSTDYKQNYVD